MSVSEYIERFHKMTTRKELNELKEVFSQFTLDQQLEAFKKIQEEMCTQ